MSAIDLNADLGETVGGIPTADDEAMFALVTSASIACGGHAGDAASVAEAVERARRHGVVIGAHPSYPDPAGFGRTVMALAADELRATLDEQLTRLRRAGADIRYVKPHGALYNRIVSDAGDAAVVADAVAYLSAALGRALPVLGLGGAIARAARERDLPFVQEAFLDRGYRADGTLVPRGEPGALLEDAGEVAERAVLLARERVVASVDGARVEVEAASLCVHGDTPAAVAMARAVRVALEDAGVEVRAPW
ncbi:5-oxoprolinase subunit PxpA [Microbacterium aureliae]